jgi:ABC-type lipoprotein release transport system permease subunit
MRSKPVLTFQDFSGNITGGAFRITGIFATDSKMFDEMNVFVKRSDLERIAGFTPSSAHEIAVLFKDNDDLKERTQEIVAVSPDNLEVKNWKDLYPELGMMSLMTQKYLFYLVAIIMFALAFGIINTMMMSILERRKELGMLMAIGMTQRKIRKMIIWETLFLTAVGSFAGLLINQGLVSYFGSRGLDFSAFAEGFSEYGFSAVFYPEISGMFYFQIVGLVVLTALVAAIFPIIRAGKMKPSEILTSN